MSKKISFQSVLDKHKGREFLVCCPGKNIIEWKERVSSFALENELMVIGLNKVPDIIVPNYHLFTNNDKYEHYGDNTGSSTVLLGSGIRKEWILKHSPREYVLVKYNDRNKNEPDKYNSNKDVIEGYYRTSGNLAIMVSHLMGASVVYIAGMCGFTFQFDGTVHYYKAEIGRDVKSKKEWHRKYDNPVGRSLDNLKAYGIKFKIITPTIYEKHFDGEVLSCDA